MFLLGTEGQSGWPAIIPTAYAAFPFRCARLSDAWPVGDAVAAHGRLGVDVHLLVEDWTTAPATIVATLQRYPTLTNVELGNEDSYSYKNGNNTTTLRTKAGNYARAIAALRSALDAVGLTRVGIIAQNDYALWAGSTWVDAMYAAVPNLHSYVRAWCCHPYFAHEEVDRIQTGISQASAHGCPTNFPYWLTEFGVSTSGGTAFTNSDGNYGRAVNLTYAQAAADATKVIERIAEECPSVERLFWFGMIDAGTDPTDREQNFGYLLRDTTTKPAIGAALTALLAYVPTQRVEVRGQIASGGSTGTTLAASQPAETRAGDALLCGVYVTGADVDIQMAGWTERRDLFSSFNFAVFERVAAVDGAATHTITWGGASRYRAATIVALVGSTVNTSRIVDAEGDVASAASRTVTGPRLTSTVDRARALWWAVTDAPSVITPPADMPTILDGSSTGAPTAGWAEDPIAVAGTTTAALTGSQTVSTAVIVAAQAISPALPIVASSPRRPVRLPARRPARIPVRG